MIEKEPDFQEFYHDPCQYMVWSRDDGDLATQLSLVVIEDEPGPYLDFLHDCVFHGLCRKAMALPFSDQSIAVLSGEESCFGKSSEVRVRIPEISQCVAIVDMRNTSRQTFQGYDAANNEIAGHQFRKQLEQFLGSGFYATRYGRAHLDEKGISRDWGVVTLKMKAGKTDEPMPSADRNVLMEVLEAHFKTRDVSKVNIMELRGSSVAIRFQGIWSAARILQPESFFRLLIQDYINNGVGLTPKELCDRLNVRRQGSRVHANPERISEKEKTQFKQMHAALKPIILEKRKAIEKLKSSIPELEQCAQRKLQQVKIEIQKQLDELFDPGTFRFEQLSDPPSDLGLTTSETLSFEKLRETATKAGAEAGRELSDAQESMKRISDELTRQNEELSDYYRSGFLSWKDGNDYVVPEKTSDDADHARQWKGRLLEDLKGQHNALISHLDKHIEKVGDRWKYTGAEMWRMIGSK